MNIKERVKPILPDWLLKAASDYRFRRLNRVVDRQFTGKSTQEIFSAIYQEGTWGKSPAGEFCSGSGSHDPSIIAPYLQAVTGFLDSLPTRPNAVDLGCGDFNVGSQLRPHCAGYTACDIVPALIESNKQRFHHLDVDFRCLNASTDPLPDGDIVFIRQVLQHLRNEEILNIVQKLNKYSFLVLSEHLPDYDFQPNLEKPTGPGIRIGIKSGIVLSAPPFNLRFKSENHVCSVQERASVIRTTIYQLN